MSESIEHRGPMIHNGVSNLSPYFLEAMRVDIAIFGRAFVWRPGGTTEEWLIPPQWVAEVKSNKGRTIRWQLVQTGAIGDRVIDVARDDIEVRK